MCVGGSYPGKHNPTRARSFPWTPMEYMGGPQCLLQRAMLPVTEAFFTAGTIGSFNPEQIECKHQNASCVLSSMIVCWGPAHRLQVSRNPHGLRVGWPERQRKDFPPRGAWGGPGIRGELGSCSPCPVRAIVHRERYCPLTSWGLHSIWEYFIAARKPLMLIIDSWSVAPLLEWMRLFGCLERQWKFNQILLWTHFVILEVI